VYSEADRNSLQRALRTTRPCALDRPRSAERFTSYPQVISAAEITNVTAIHPGYGFLSRNAKFRQSVRSVRDHFYRPPTAE